MLERIRLLNTVPLFEHLAPPVLWEVGEHFQPKHVLRGGFVFLEGEPANTLNLVAEGRIKIIRETDEGRQVILRLIHSGELFGVSGGWGQTLYPASARALDDAVVLQLPAREFTRLLSDHPELVMVVLRELGRQLRDAEGRILDLQTEPAKQRIARALLRLATSAGTDSPGDRRITLMLSRQDLADLSGTTLSTASRTLSGWHRRGIVLAGREQVTITKLFELQEIAHTVGRR